VAVGGAGYFTKWDPDHPKLHHAAVPPGWYSVEIRGDVLREGQPEEEWIYEFVLEPKSSRPEFAALLAQPVSLFPQEQPRATRPPPC
jgi:hypothetical protein